MTNPNSAAAICIYIRTMPKMKQDRTLPEQRVIIIVFFRQKILSYKRLTQGLDGLHLLRVTLIVDFNRYYFTAPPFP